MMPTTGTSDALEQMFERFLLEDERAAWAWEFEPEPRATQLKLATPRTNLGRSRGRFRLLAEALAPMVASGASICDVGAYPGTLLRLIRRLPGGSSVTLGAAGLGISGPYREALDALGIAAFEAEFDVRATDSGIPHLLELEAAATGDWDVVVCTEVIEHQLQPLSLLVGCHRLLRPGGALVLTTNNAAFIGDALKLLAGRHNLNALEHSHVLLDDLWRPHIRLFLLTEIVQLLELAGFVIDEATFFDNGNVYGGAKGVAIGAIRRATGIVPRFRSHLFVRATKSTDPSPAAWRRLDESFASFGLRRPSPAVVVRS
jgi:SAM-dependent methyltransferase